MSNNNFTSFWQSPLWSDILSRTDQAESIWYIFQSKKILIERRKIVGKYTGLYILWWEENSITQECLDGISQKVVWKTDLFLQIEPIANWLPIQSTKYKIQNKAPFRRFIEPVTALIPLSDTTAEKVFQNFKEKGRYNIRVAERRGVTTQWVKWDNICPFFSPDWSIKKQTYAEVFFDLLEETTKRDNFSHNALPYYQTFLQILEKNNAGWLLIAVRENIIHAAGVFVYWNNHAIYYYGASSSLPEIRRDHGAHLLQWHAIQEALRRGCSDYDLLGISSHEWDKLAGVTTFKMWFWPKKVIIPPEKVIILRPRLLKMLQSANKLRKMLRPR